MTLDRSGCRTLSLLSFCRLVDIQDRNSEWLAHDHQRLGYLACVFEFPFCKGIDMRCLLEARRRDFLMPICRTGLRVMPRPTGLATAGPALAQERPRNEIVFLNPFLCEHL